MQEQKPKNFGVEKKKSKVKLLKMYDKTRIDISGRNLPILNICLELRLR